MSIFSLPNLLPNSQAYKQNLWNTSFFLGGLSFGYLTYYLLVGNRQSTTAQTAKASDANEPAEDPLFEEAARLVVRNQQASKAQLQREFQIGYPRATELIKQLEKNQIIGPANGSKPREVLIAGEAALEPLLKNSPGSQ